MHFGEDFKNKLEELEYVANKEYDGHYSIFKFTTCYIVVLGSQCQIESTIDKQRINFYMFPKFEKLDQAIQSALDFHYEGA